MVQMVGSVPVDRTQHVWKELSGKERGLFQCVLCGGVSARPDSTSELRQYRPLTPADRNLCPPKE